MWNMPWVGSNQRTSDQKSRPLPMDHCARADLRMEWNYMKLEITTNVCGRGWEVTTVLDQRCGWEGELHPTYVGSWLNIYLLALPLSVIKIITNPWQLLCISTWMLILPLFTTESPHNPQYIRLFNGRHHSNEITWVYYCTIMESYISYW